MSVGCDTGHSSKHAASTPCGITPDSSVSSKSLVPRLSTEVVLHGQTQPDHNTVTASATTALEQL